MSLFNLPTRSTREADQTIVKKSKQLLKSAPSVIKGGKGGLMEKILTITAVVSQNLGKYADKYDCYRGVDVDKFIAYIDKCIENGIVSIDTETTGLNPLECIIAGVSLYTPGEKAIYVPINHVSYITGMKADNQIDSDIVKQQLSRLSTCLIIMHNAKFDIRIIQNQVGHYFTQVYWDTMLAAKLLNENEPAGLKVLHNKYCGQQDSKIWDFSSLFDGVIFTHIPINTGYIYAARDAEITYELYLFQKQYLDPNCCDEYKLEKVSKVFFNIEMPLVPVIAMIEDTGITIDRAFAATLSTKYNIELGDKEKAFYNVLDMYKNELLDYRKKNPNSKLSDPISISSNTQIAILLYDILKLPIVDKDKPRGTGEEIISQMDTPIAKAILDYRETAKLLSTYVDKLPKIINPKTGRIHCSFNQYGADTGRLSSSDPNMQNIPSKNKEIRKMFTAAEGYVLIGCDYSQQEPRILAHLSQDINLIQAYVEGKDIYSWCGSLVYKIPYDECKEYRIDGTKNPEGKKRRGAMKSIILGIMYDMGVASISEQLGIPKKEAQNIIDKFFASFPGVKKCIEETKQHAIQYGFVETVWGRKRRLPNMQLDPFELIYEAGKAGNFDPLFDEEEEVNNELSSETRQLYLSQLNNCRSWKEKDQIKARAKAEGITVKDNGGYIAEASRQCLNSRVQGSAADMTKLAMTAIGTDHELANLGYRLLLSVHDELIGECPIKNAKACGELVSKIMIKVADTLLVPMKCDAEITKEWYGEEIKIV